MKHCNCIVAQSGGPTAAINASLAGTVQGIMDSKAYDVCYGSINGILGILHSNCINLTEEMSDSGRLDALKTTPAMYLGSCRFRLPSDEKDEVLYQTVFRYLMEKEIQVFFYIGGNDSMDTVLKLSDYGKKIKSNIQFIGIPKTIDNDLCFTDHTPGFGSAAKYIASSVLEITYDTLIYPVKSVTIIEIMGRDAGWLTASSALARNPHNPAPHLIYLPEVPFSKERFLCDLKEQLRSYDNIIVAVSEGIQDENGTYLNASDSDPDIFGHRQLSGVGKTLEYFIRQRLNIKVRSVEINVLQRCAAHLVSLTDIQEAFQQGEYAVRLAEKSQNGIMVTIRRTSDDPYAAAYHFADIRDVANKERKVPRSWINEDGNDISDALLNYMKPLIYGEVPISYKDGVPIYLNVSHLSEGKKYTEEKKYT